jgi:glycosyltransferase involved in cell wall biosynthesis
MACLFLLNSLNIGGSEKKSARLANALTKRGHDIHIAFLNLPDDLKNEIDDSIPILYLNRIGKFGIKVLPKLVRYLRERNINMLFCMNLYPYLYGFIAKTMLREAGIRCLAFINITDFLHVKEKIQMAIYGPLLRQSPKLVFGCLAQLNQWTARYFLPRDRSTVIYNGVDCSLFSPHALNESPSDLREKHGFPSTDFIITTVAELRPEKGHGDLIKACGILFRAGHPVRLVLVGDGPEKQRLEKQIDALGLTDRIHFWGRLDDVRPALSMADLFALPSVAVETFSNATLEAMAMGKPVVLSAIGGATEMVIPGENGYLFPVSDVDALVEIIEGLITNPDTTKKMGEKARAITLNRFDFEGMLDQYERLLLSPVWPDEETASSARQPE